MLRNGLFCLFVLSVLTCAGTRSTMWVSPGDSRHIPVVEVEGPELSREVVITTRLPGIDVPRIQEDINRSGRMIVTVSIRNDSRTQQMVEIKTKFFTASGGTLDALKEWDQVFVNPGEIKRVEFTCGESGASFFKVLLR